jgi:hypothetical protein
MAKKKKSSKPASSEAQQQREEARRRAAAQRRAREEAEKKRKDRIAQIRKLVTPTLAVIAVFALSIMIIRPAPEVRAVKRASEIEVDVEVLGDGETFDYGTPTPTSGPYAPGNPICGVFAEQVAAEDAVAAQKVGAVVLWYSDPDLAEPLAAYAETFESHVIVSPNAAIDEPIVATAWQRFKAYDTVDDVVEDDFAGVYRLQRDTEGACPRQ